MKARLKDGTIVLLEKACGCSDELHVGPHWLHMDAYTKKKNLECLHAGQAAAKRPGLVAQIQAAALLNRFAELEQQRLKALEFDMIRLGIEEIIRDV